MGARNISRFKQSQYQNRSCKQYCTTKFNTEQKFQQQLITLSSPKNSRRIIENRNVTNSSSESWNEIKPNKTSLERFLLEREFSESNTTRALCGSSWACSTSDNLSTSTSSLINDQQ
ncbi:hypothetical protein QQG55_54410 [Brugia pahangi]